MTRRSRMALALVAFALGAHLGAGTAAAAAAPAPAGVDTTRVSYLAGASVYLEAGRQQGLSEGDTVRILRDGWEIARARVTYASTKRAVCDTLSTRAFPRIGDLALYLPHAVPAAVDSTAAATAPAAADTTRAALLPLPGTAPMPARRSRLVQGRVAVGYMGTSGDMGGYRQPSVDAYVQGRNALGGAVDFAVDMRSHRTYLEGLDEDQTRVYSFSATLHDATGSKRLTVGRQLAPSLGAAGHFDGLLAEYQKRTWSLGLFSGFTPATATYGFDTGVVQNGGYLRVFHAAPGRQWSFLLGGLDSRDQGIPNRTAVFAQGSYSDRRLYISLAQDVDFNSSWKQDLGEAPVEPTASLVNARLQAGRGVMVYGGYDNRRNVRLASDRLTPEFLFDASHRQGFWAGASTPLRWNLYLDATGRRIDGGAAGSGWTASAALEARRLALMNGTLRLRSTRVDGAMETGWLHAASFSFLPSATAQVSVGAGTETMEDALGGGKSRLGWESLDADLGVGQHWYLLLSTQLDHGDMGSGLRNYAALSWIF